MRFGTEITEWTMGGWEEGGIGTWQRNSCYKTAEFRGVRCGEHVKTFGYYGALFSERERECVILFEIGVMEAWPRYGLKGGHL